MDIKSLISVYAVAISITLAASTSDEPAKKQNPNESFVSGVFIPADTLNSLQEKSKKNKESSVKDANIEKHSDIMTPNINNDSSFPQTAAQQVITGNTQTPVQNQQTEQLAKIVVQQSTVNQPLSDQQPSYGTQQAILLGPQQAYNTQPNGSPPQQPGFISSQEILLNPQLNNPQPYRDNQQSNTAYVQPNGFNQQLNSYNQLPNGYNQQSNGDNQPPIGYNQPLNGYNQPPNSYNGAPNGYNQLPNNYNQPLNDYNQPPNGYNNQPPNGYNNQPPNGYNQPLNGYNYQPGDNQQIGNSLPYGNNQQQNVYSSQPNNYNQQPIGQNGLNYQPSDYNQQMGKNQNNCTFVSKRLSSQFGLRL